jgi:hypothetical protein
MEPGTYMARCTAVIDLGIQRTEYNGEIKEQPKILLIFEFPDEFIERDGEQLPRWMSNIYTFSAHEKSTLRQTLKSWRGRDFTDEELKDFDIKNVLNAPCMITVTHTVKGDKTYANIGAVGKLMKGAQVADVREQYYFNIDDNETWAIFPDLPEWIQAKINESLTFKNKGIQLSKEGKVFHTGKPAPQDMAQNAEDFAEIDDDGDLPF